MKHEFSTLIREAYSCDNSETTPTKSLAAAEHGAHTAFHFTGLLWKWSHAQWPELRRTQ